MRSYEKKGGTGEKGIKKKLNALGQTASWGLLECVLLNDIQFLADFDEGGNGAVELFAGVSCRQLDADTCLSFRYNRIIETGDVDVFFLQFCGELL